MAASWVECPIRAIRSLVVAPAAAARVAALWRRSWKRRPSTPTAFVAGSQTRRRKLLRRIHPPSAAGKTRPAAPGSAQVARCSLSAPTTKRGSATERRPASLLGALRRNCPLISVTCSATWTVLAVRSTRWPDQLAPAQPAVAGHEDQGAVPRRDRVGQGVDLLGRRAAHLGRVLLAGTLDAPGGVEDVALLDRRAEDAGEQPVRLGDRGAAELRPRAQLSKPVLDHHVVDLRERDGLERRLDEAAQQVAVQVARGRPQLRVVHPAVGPFAERDGPRRGSWNSPRVRSASTRARYLAASALVRKVCGAVWRRPLSSQ